MTTKTFLALILITGLSYCSKKETPSTTQVDCATVNAKFSTDIAPLIQSKCATAGCHNNSAAGGTILLNYAQISSKSARINQRAIIQKDMPQGGSLTTLEIDKLKCWIESGAPNN